MTFALVILIGYTGVIYLQTYHLLQLYINKTFYVLNIFFSISLMYVCKTFYWNEGS